MSLLKKQNKEASFITKGHAAIVKPQDKEGLRQLAQEIKQSSKAQQEVVKAKLLR